jgi:hypothetical protein
MMSKDRHRSFLYFELLEPRRMLTVTLDSNGWYNVAPSADTRIVYVSSSSGLNTNDGLTPDTPLQTIGAGEQLIRDGSADWLLLKRGDTFNSGFDKWKISGRSSDEPLLIGAYGEGDRPLLNTGTTQGFFTDYGGNPVNNIAITGLHFIANTYDGRNGAYETAGIRLLRQGQNYLIQDMKIEGYKDNIVLQGDGTGLTNIEINRVISIDAFNHGNVGNGHAQGLYAYERTDGLTVERSFFDHNGWKDADAVATIFNHDLYINTGAKNVIVRNNIIARGANNGLLLRAGGTIQDNLFISNSVAGIVDNTDSTITGNVVLGSVPVPGVPQGVGFNVETDTSAYIANNIIAHDINSGTGGIAGISINNDAAHITVENNTVYDWRNGINNGGNRKITIRDNATQAPTDTTKPIMQNRFAANPATYTYSNNLYYSKKSKPFQVNGVDQTLASWISLTQESNAQFQKLNYVDPNRTIASYNATLGGEATTEAFLAAARNQNASWDPNLSAAAVGHYIRAGFAAAAPTGQISGNVFDDVTGDGIRDSFDTPLGAGITVYLDSNNDGQRQGNEPSTTTDSSGNFGFTNLADGTYYVRVDPAHGQASSTVKVIVAGGATYAGRDIGLTQTAPPIRIVSKFDSEKLISLTLAFNTDVSATLDRDDLQVINLITGAPADMSAFTFTESAPGAGTVASWSATTLANGNYRMTLPAAAVSSFGVGLTSDFTQNFALLNGDANRSGTVDITDFNVLASNFGKSGMTFSQGNFDFSADGKVTLQDFSVLASNFGKSLAPLSTAPDVQPSAMQTAIAQPAHSSKLPAVAKNKPDLLEDASLK